MSSLSSVKIRTDSGKIIHRIPKSIPFGSFQYMTIRFKGNLHLVGDGNEHLRDGNGYGSIFALGKNLGPYTG